MKKIYASLVIIMFFTSLLHASYNEALDFFKAKKYIDSLQSIAKKLDVKNDLNPGSDNFKLRYLAAYNHWELGNSRSAIAHFKRCIDIQNDNVNPYLDLSLHLFEQKRYTEAELIIQKGLKINKSPEFYYILGRISLRRKNYWRAKGLFEKTNSLSSDLFGSYNGLGIALMNLKKYSNANTAFSVALALNPDSPELLNNIALSLEMMKKNSEAYKYIEQANLIEVKNKTIKRNMRRLKNKILAKSNI